LQSEINTRQPDTRNLRPAVPTGDDSGSAAGEAKPCPHNDIVDGPTRHNEVSRRDVLRFGTLGVGAAFGLSRLGGQLRGASGSVGGPEASRPTFAVKKPISLTLWNWAGTSITENQFAAVKAAMGKKYSNVTLDVKTYTGGDAGIAEKLNLALTAHTTLPDIVFLNYIEVPEFAVKGAIMNLGDYYKHVQGKLYAGAEAVAKVNGEYFAVANELKSKLFYYRKDLFESAGIDSASIPNMSVAEYIQMGKTFTAKHPGKYIMNLGNEPPEYLFGELISAYAPISFANRQGKYDITSNPAFADVLSFMHKIYASGIAYPVIDFSTAWPAAIKAEKICGFLIAIWMDSFLPSYATMSAYGKWGAVPWPKLSPLADQRYGSDAGGEAWVIPVGSSNRSLAAELIADWHFDDRAALRTFEVSGQLPTLSSIQDQVISAVESQKKPPSMSKTDWLELPQNYFGGSSYIKLALESQNWDKVFGFDPKALVDWETIMVNWMYKAVQGKVSVEAALKGMQSQMESQVGNPWSAS
jgi:ABC-type glycerol-3-phosphate transport system substrate-binding protein